MNTGYNPISKLLHWFLAVLLVGQLILGWWGFMSLHKSFGIIIGTLVLLRILWRLAHTPAPLPASVPLWQSKASRFVHFLLYACMVVMPVTGFLGASLGQYGISFFGFTLPRFFGENHSLSKQLFDVHIFFVWVLVGLIGLHVLAGLKHLIINKDRVFQRMWF